MKEISSKIPSVSECLAAADDTRCMLLKEDALGGIPEVLKAYYCENGGKECAAFCFSDKNTFKAAGKTVEGVLASAGIKLAGSFVFEGGIHADYEHVGTIKNELEKAQKNASGGQSVLVPIAVGAGTINDLVKRASGESGLPYLCVPTAASVDGYTAYGSALLHEGFKQTMSCKAPLALVADPKILADAPAYLSSSGFGDLAGKIIAGTDWIIADCVFELDGKGELAPGTAAIDSTAWMMVQNPLKANIASSVNAAKGDRAAVNVLFEALGVTGFALQYMKDSRSVSGCEHMLSHVWEMENLCVNGVPVTHGHKVAMGTLAAAAFTECLFTEKPPLSKKIPDWAGQEKTIRDAFCGVKQLLPAILETARSKFICDGAKLIKLREGILDSWDTLKNDIFERLPPFKELYALFCEAGCPVMPETINLTNRRVLESTVKAQMIRKRFTVLDMAFELGVFDSVIKKMESKGYFGG